MSDSESGGWLSDAVESGRETIEAVTSTFLGVEREAHVCPDCNEPCQETYTYNPSVAAFHEGKSPATFGDYLPPETAQIAREHGYQLYAVFGSTADFVAEDSARMDRLD